MNSLLISISEHFSNPGSHFSWNVEILQERNGIDDFSVSYIWIIRFEAIFESGSRAKYTRRVRWEIQLPYISDRRFDRLQLQALKRNLAWRVEKGWWFPSYLDFVHRQKRQQKNFVRDYEFWMKFNISPWPTPLFDSPMNFDHAKSILKS